MQNAISSIQSESPQLKNYHHEELDYELKPSRKERDSGK
jgi:hypothetical protein